MTTSRDLETLLRLKALRARRARAALARVAREADVFRRQASELRAEYDGQFAETAAFARTHLGDLVSGQDFESFFMTMTLGLYRRKRRLVATGMRFKRTEAKALSAERERGEAAGLLRRLDRASDAVGDLHARHRRAEDETAELAVEDEVQEYLVGKASHA